MGTGVYNAPKLTTTARGRMKTLAVEGVGSDGSRIIRSRKGTPNDP
jgi:hypothetical protein